MKVFNKYIWILLSVFFAIAFVVFVVGYAVCKENEQNINYAIGLNPYKPVRGDQEEIINEYPSDYIKANGTLDDVAMRKHSMEVSEAAAADGAVLLWNDNDALPVKEGGKLSLFGVSTKPATYMYTGLGSGNVTVRTSDFLDLKAQFESESKYQVNGTLYDSYANTQAWKMLSNPNGDDNHYREFQVNEKAWSEVETAAGSTFAEYGDAAIYIISRTGAEDGDTWFDTSVNTKDNHVDNNYLDLTKNEQDTLTALSRLRDDGTFKSLILVINSGTPLQMKNLAGKYSVDSCLWAGMGGNASFAALYDVISGKVNPSGKLVDTYAYDGDSAPSVANTGPFEFTDGDSLPSENRGSNSYNHAFIVYEEGIYIGYRYYETRYEDTVMNKGNASSKVGVVDGSESWKYENNVKFPFGYGLSYTSFSFSDFSVKQSGDDYNVTVTVTNDGEVAGKTPVQVYLQKPYTEYDKQYGIEKSAIELCGYGKTDIIQPKASETVTVKVSGNEFRTYDSYNKKTYILEAGKYYLAVGSDVHDALNNILAKKGYKSANGMVDSLGKPADGNADMSYEINVAKDDYEKFAYSTVNKDVKITNRFDDADVKLYAGTSAQKDAVTYLSRNDWSGTYPTEHAQLSAKNRRIVEDMQYSSANGVPVAADAVMPTFGKQRSDQITLAMLWGFDYDDPLWDDLLDQITWQEAITLCGVGAHIISAVPSVASPSVNAQDGPAGVKEQTPAEIGSSMSFPDGVLLASTFDDEMIQKVGDAFGLEMIHSGVGEIYGTGAGMHRSVYGGRNWEYFSEDPFISGRALCSEVLGLQGRGAIVNIKHFILNDQEIYRCGAATFANEQTIREIYLKAFEAAIIEGHANGVMSSLNRLGCIWVGRHKGLLTDVLRNEWGFVGLVETDSATGLYMRQAGARAEAIVAGNDLWLRGTTGDELWTGFENNATVAQAIRESAHRILYTVLNSFAMDGIGTTTQFVYVEPWYFGAIRAGEIVMGIIAGLCIVMVVLSFILPKIRKKKIK